MIPYDKRSGKIWYNGELVDWSDVKVHVLSHGLHYASCVFEGERVYDGEIFKLAICIEILLNLSNLSSNIFFLASEINPIFIPL